ncbi:hypothetical protein [Enterococcus gallinarum]|uniref:hypothetical protein n=1 Tax=Enterococcus gallinarum TaxID=1353 RepID=UPI00288C73E9|nr:hypothetical protein [Enterococcus gallinarum]MDT2730602.1 hypothetical protein [Enterococcus gallinarum]
MRAPSVSCGKTPSLGGVNVAGTPWTLVVMDWYSRSVSRSVTSLAACVSVSHGV